MPPFQHHIFVCSTVRKDGAPCCDHGEGGALVEVLRAQVQQAGKSNTIAVTPCGCLGLCRRGPNVVVYPAGRWFTAVRSDEAAAIVAEVEGANFSTVERPDPDSDTIRAEISLARARQRKLRDARDRVGVMPEPLEELLRSYQGSRVVLTAVELDLFSAVGEGAAGVEIAQRIGASPTGTLPLLNALVALGLLEKEAERFRNAPLAARFLTAFAPHDARAAVLHTAQLWQRWSTLTAAVRAGGGVRLEEMAALGPEWTEPFIAAMDRNGRARAPVVIRALTLDGVTRVLDLGGGSGAYAIAFAERLPAAEVTVLDVPAVTPLTRRYAAASGVGNRIHVIDGDISQKSYGSGFDLVFVSAVCHMLSPQENAALLGKCRDALRPGGQLVIQDFVLDDDKTSPRSGALFALNMLVGTLGGSTYSGAEYLDWIKAAGFEGGALVRLPGPTGLVVARRGCP
ncbi:MAG: methyltransferase domain-containing protein [Myxococcota bacterium]|jgi:(2Fe-2S) ferredoxin/SAM-dependent methyltransferase|nr:methyltransferase domain-containing protein [Myxococcota bacterium]